MTFPASVGRYNRFVTSPIANELELLRQARTRSETLLNELLQRQEELVREPPDLPPQQLAEGRASLQGAIDAARKMCENIGAALRLAKQESSNETTP